MAAMVFSFMMFAPGAFWFVMLSANASLRDVALDEVCVPRILRSALGIAFRDSGGALLIRGPWLQKVGPGSAVHREERCTASGTRADIHVPASRSRKTWMARTSCVKTRFALLPGHDEKESASPTSA
jgi:hypothetical protein